MYFRIGLRIASVMGRVNGGACPLAKAVNVEQTAPR
jgi:hypothetical protein